VRSRELSVREIATSTLEAIDQVDRDLKAFTYVDQDQVLARAGELDNRLARDADIGPLAGVPIGVKDLFDVCGLPTSYGSRTFKEYFPTRDATSVSRLISAGGLIVGKTRTAELAWGEVTPPTKNPADPRLIAGGSSGGSAAAVGAHLVHAGLGTDTGGSIRMPAAMCGIVGIKPTYGAVSLSGVLPGCWALDHAGPLTRSVLDARAILKELVAHDPSDPASAPPRALKGLRDRLATQAPGTLVGARLAYLDEPLFEVVDDRARAYYQDGLARLSDSGAVLFALRLPDVRFAPSAALAISLSEGAAVHTERFRARRHEFSDDVRAAMQVAHVIPGTLAARAHQARRHLTRCLAKLFADSKLDALVAPANIAPAIPTDELDVVFRRSNGELEPVLWWGYSRAFYLANLTGQPALVMPVSASGPPIGIQFIGMPFQDDRVLDIGADFERFLPLNDPKEASA
jgi:aspartyl-tRNA(Asn)/glutamyl-tRNA(Gln) amidotransferase subunit A